MKEEEKKQDITIERKILEELKELKEKLEKLETPVEPTPYYPYPYSPYPYYPYVVLSVLLSLCYLAFYLRQHCCL